MRTAWSETVKFEARIKELVENHPDLAVLVEPLLNGTAGTARTVRHPAPPFRCAYGCSPEGSRPTKSGYSVIKVVDPIGSVHAQLGKHYYRGLLSIDARSR